MNDEEKLQTLAAQAYQVIGSALHSPSYRDNDEVIRALDYFFSVSNGGEIDEDFLPWCVYKSLDTED